MSDSWKDEPEEGEVTYGMVMPFLDQSLAFTLGFEAGQEYGRMAHQRAGHYEQTIHVENQRQISMAAKVLGWEVRFEPLDDTFCTLHAVRWLVSSPAPEGETR